MDVNSIATSGLRAADLQLATSANNVANANTPGYKQQDVVQTSDANGGVQAQTVDSDQDVDTGEQLVKADIATYNFKANLTVLKKQHEAEKSLLNIVA